MTDIFKRNTCNDIVLWYVQIWKYIDEYTCIHSEISQNELMNYVMNSTRGTIHPKIVNNEISKLFEN